MDSNTVLQTFIGGMQEVLLFIWKYGWWGILGVFIYFIVFPLYMNWRRNKFIQDQGHVLLKVQVPRDNEKTPLAAEQMFANMQGVWDPIDELKLYWDGQILEHLGFELVSIGGHIYYILAIPTNYKDLVIGQIHSAYPDAEIEEVKDYATNFDETKHKMYGFEFSLMRSSAYPIRTYPEIEREIKTKEAKIDLMEGITSILNRITDKEQIWIQILARPTTGKEWIKEGEEIINEIKEGKKGNQKPRMLDNVLSSTQEAIGGAVSQVLNPNGEEEGGRQESQEFEAMPFMIDTEREIVVKTGKNIAKPAYEIKMRVIYMGEKDVFSKIRFSQIIGSFQQFKTNNLNAFKPGKWTLGKVGWFEFPPYTRWKQHRFLKQYQEREFNYWDKGFVLNIEALATIYHFPEMCVQTPTIHQVNSKRAAAPADLPTESTDDDITLFAKTNFRDNKTPFGIKDEDRTKHIYTIGKTGMGKTAMLGNMIISDIRRGKGVALVDPHGDLAEDILDFIPKDRINDVIYFNPSDQDFPIGFNILEDVDLEFRGLVASGLVGIFKKIWADSWGPRLEYILRYTILALLEYPNSTILGILRMLSDNDYRKKVVQTIKDPVVKAFWTTEFANYNDRLRAEAVAPIQNKVGQFVSNPLMRNILGQTKSTFDIDKIMDEGKILLINLSKGKIGEDNSALLGAMLITKMQLAAMRRAHIPEKERKDVYLYVDEFQNFATESFATILSEARKYRLSITLAHQYITQMEEDVRDAVFGNVGTIIAFRVGAVDAEFIEQETTPIFTQMDIVDLDKYNAYVKLAIDGVTSRAFSATTLAPYEDREGEAEKIKDISRERYSRDRKDVEEKIGRWSLSAIETAEKETARKEEEHKRRSSRGQRIGKNGGEESQVDIQELKKLKKGQIIEGEISKILDFGIFVQFGDNLEGLVHVSEISQKRVDHPSDLFQTGDKIKAVILNIDLQKKQVSLSIKRVKQISEQKTNKDTGKVRDKNRAELKNKNRPKPISKAPDYSPKNTTPEINKKTYKVLDNKNLENILEEDGMVKAPDIPVEKNEE